MRYLTVSFLATLVALMAPALSAAEDPRETADPSRWVEKALQDGLLEVALGKAAQEKGQSAAVRAYGARMVADHAKLNTALASLGTRKGLNVPQALDPAHRSMVNEVSAATESRFDSVYAQHMITDHARVIALFTQATQGADRDLASFAQSALGTLKEHKRLADALGAAAQSDVKSKSSTEER